MNLEERIVAVRAKFQEAAEELLELVSRDPGNVSEIMEIAHPGGREAGWSVQRIVETTVSCPHGAELNERFEMPNVFLEIERRSVRREKGPTDVLIPNGRVFLMVGVMPESETESQIYRDLAAGTITGEEYTRRMREEKARQGLYESDGPPGMLDLKCSCEHAEGEG